MAAGAEEEGAEEEGVEEEGEVEEVVEVAIGDVGEWLEEVGEDGDVIGEDRVSIVEANTGDIRMVVIMVVIMGFLIILHMIF